MPCHTIFQKSLSEIWLTQWYAPDTVDIYRYMPFALPDTVTDTINLFAVLLSPDFTCRGKNNLTSDIVYMLPFYALRQWRFNLFTAHHAVCAVRLRFSNRHGHYFSYLTGSSPIWDFIWYTVIDNSFARKIGLVVIATVWYNLNKDFGDLQGFCLCPVGLAYVLQVLSLGGKQLVLVSYPSHITIWDVIALWWITHVITSLFNCLGRFKAYPYVIYKFGCLPCL